MSIYGQTSCTLSTITDVKSIYTYHCLISSTYAPGMAPTDNISPLDSNNQVKDTIVITYNSNTYTWTLVEPNLDITNIDLNKLYYIDCTIFSNNTYDWGPALVSSSYEAAKQAYNKANIASGLVGDMNQHFWWLTSAYSTGVPAGAYVTNDNQYDFKTDPSNKSNLLLQSAGISLRHGTDTKAQLTTNGLKISQGGVEAGTSNTNNYVYISSENGPRIAINGYTPPDPTAQATLNAPQWREIIGTKFGVLSDGTLYANEAHINGAITATSLTIGSNATINDASGLIRNDAIDIGGRNLFQNSTQILSNGSVTDTKNYFTLYLWSVPEESYTGYKAVMPDSKNITTTGYFSYTFIAAAESQAYWALKHNGSSHDFVLYFENSIDIKAGDELTLSFDVIGCDPSVENGLQIKNFKLEKGNKATDWTPAPEDIQNALGNKTENSDFDEYKEAVGNDLKDITDSAFGDEDSLSTRLSSVSTEFGNLSTEYDELSNDIKTYMSFDGSLILGNSESGSNVTITDTQVQFKSGDNVVGYIAGDGLHVDNYLSFGNFMFYQRTNGHFTLKYLKKEDSE